MNNAIFNKNVELLQGQFTEQFIPLRAAASYYGCDYRTLEARKDFPLVRMGRTPGVNLVQFAAWLTEAQG